VTKFLQSKDQNIIQTTLWLIDNDCYRGKNQQRSKALLQSLTLLSPNGPLTPVVLHSLHTKTNHSFNDLIFQILSRLVLNLSFDEYLPVFPANNKILISLIYQVLNDQTLNDLKNETQRKLIYGTLQNSIYLLNRLLDNNNHNGINNSLKSFLFMKVLSFQFFKCLLFLKLISM
jgi:hypothetical protein